MVVGHRCPLPLIIITKHGAQVFAFGGTAGTASFVDPHVRVYDCQAQQWRLLQGAPGPGPRSGAPWVYDAKLASLLLFGGWRNMWLGDLWRLDVGRLVGPPYACMGVEPAMGAVSGGVTLTVHGLRFVCVDYCQSVSKHGVWCF